MVNERASSIKLVDFIHSLSFLQAFGLKLKRTATAGMKAVMATANIPNVLKAASNFKSSQSVLPVLLHKIALNIRSLFAS